MFALLLLACRSEPSLSLVDLELPEATHSTWMPVEAFAVASDLHRCDRATTYSGPLDFVAIDVAPNGITLDGERLDIDMKDGLLDPSGARGFVLTELKERIASLASQRSTADRAGCGVAKRGSLVTYQEGWVLVGLDRRLSWDTAETVLATVVDSHPWVALRVAGAPSQEWHEPPFMRTIDPSAQLVVGDTGATMHRAQGAPVELAMADVGGAVGDQERVVLVPRSGRSVAEFVKVADQISERGEVAFGGPWSDLGPAQPVQGGSEPATSSVLPASGSVRVVVLSNVPLVARKRIPGPRIAPR